MLSLEALRVTRYVVSGGVMRQWVGKDDDDEPEKKFSSLRINYKEVGFSIFPSRDVEWVLADCNLLQTDAAGAAGLAEVDEVEEDKEMEKKEGARDVC
jgi:hypothetical protein